MRFSIFCMLSVVSLFADAQTGGTWRDPSPHQVHLIRVDEQVTLEVLDWGGDGRPVALLAGLGNTAHVFDDFAPKLAARYHVYGITRRGFGESSVPQTGYGADNLANDVLSVLDRLSIERPVLVGHSIAGSELSSIGTRYPERVAGLVYLDAGYEYAYFDPDLDQGDPLQLVQTLLSDLPGIINKLEQLRSAASDPRQFTMAAGELLETDLPRLENELRTAQESAAAQPISPTPPGLSDRASFESLAAWYQRSQGYNIPVSDLHAGFVADENGRPVSPKTPPYVQRAIQAGRQKFTDIKGPVLAIYSVPKDPGFPFADEQEKAVFVALDSKRTERQIQAFLKGVPQASIVRISQAHHYVFQSNASQVLLEIQQFIDGLRD